MRKALALVVAGGIAAACTSFGGDDADSNAPAPPTSGSDSGVDPVTGIPVDEAFTIDAIAQPVQLVQGATVKIPVRVKRGRNLTRPITISAKGLREGLAAAPLVITGETGDLEITVGASTAQGAADGSIEGTVERQTVTIPLKGFVRGGPGVVDTSYGIGGTVLELAGAAVRGIVTDLVLAPDDSVFVVADCSSSGDVTCIVHVGADGTVDKSYGVGGVAVLGFANPNGAALQTDGKLVVVGGSGGAGGTPAAIGRVLANGMPDTTMGLASFGPGTQRLTTGGLSGTNEGALGVAVRNADGDIFVAWDNLDGADVKNAMMRLTPTGTSRNGFGAAGTQRYAVGRTTGIAVRNEPGASQGNLAMLWTGGTGASAYAAFLQVDGSTGGVDPQYGSGTPKYTPMTGVRRPGLKGLPGLVKLADGSIVAPFQGDGVYLRKWTALGDPAPGFGTAGVAGPFPKSNGAADVTGIAMQADGKFLVSFDNEGGPEVMRITAAGQLDTGFGSKGSVQTSIGTSFSMGRRVVVAKSGRIVLSGVTYRNSDYYPALIAYWP